MWVGVDCLATGWGRGDPMLREGPVIGQEDHVIDYQETVHQPGTGKTRNGK